MTEKRFGDIVINVHGDTVFFKRDGSDTFCLPIKQLPLILEFLETLDADKLERRRTLRVPVKNASAISTRLIWKGHQSAGDVKNISLRGILVQIPSDAQPAIGEKIRVNLAHDRLATSVEGIVCRGNLGLFAIEFSPPPGDRTFRPPASLFRLVSKLEQEWLERRIYGAQEPAAIN